MAKNNNLTDFLTGVANAIRAKKGTTDLINPQDFESEIASIETGGGGTSAVLGELNVSSNGIYEAGSKMTLVPGGLYRFKEQLPVETLAELHSATQGNNGEIFSVLYQEMPLTQLTIHKKGDIYILESSTIAKLVENIYSTGNTTFTYHSIIDNSDVTVELTPGWNTFTPQGKNEVPVLSSIRLPQDISRIPGGVINLVDVQFDTSNCVEAIPDKSSIAITIKNLGQFVKLTGGFDLTKRLSPVSLGNIDEFNPDPNGEMVMLLLIQRSIAFSDLQDDIDGIKYLKIATDPPIFLMYIEDNSKIQVTSGTAENGCWYLAFDMYFGDDYPWIFAYDKDLVDGYNKVTVNVPSQAKLQSKTATSNGVYSPDEGFDGLSQVTVDFALQDKTITANGTYTCDEGYGGLGQVIANVKPKLQTKTITKNGTYTASTGYDGLKQVTVNVATTKESRTLLNNGKLAVHTVVGTDDLSLDSNKATIEELIVNDGVTSVSKGNGYTSLKRVVLPDTLETIGNQAFDNCSGLTNINIPDSVTSIGSSAFYNCSGLTNVTIPDSVTSIGNYAFYDCSGLTSVTIGNGVTSIGSAAFYKCSGLTNVTIPDSVNSIGNSTFYGCSGLTGVTIPNSVTSIGNQAFSGCSGLTSVTIGNGVTNIYYDAFKNCSGLTRVDISDLSAWCKIKFGNFSANPLYYAKNLYLNNELVTDLVIPNDVTSIGTSVFSGYSKLTSVIIPDIVTSIGSQAFYECSGLTSVTIGNGVTSIGNQAFYYCSGLTSVTIPDSVTSIGRSAFSICNGLTSVTIGNSVTTIGDEAFSKCTGLTSITIPDSVTSIGDEAFWYCTGLTGVYINDLSAWCKIQFGDFSANPLYYAKKLYLNNELVTNLVVPNGITSIGRAAFYNCSSLTSVNIPDSVTSIEWAAFSGCSGLTSVTIPDSVTSIGKSAFSICNGLTSVTIGNSVTTIGDNAFDRCSKLTSIAIPNSVKSIGNYAFDICKSLRRVDISDLSAWCKIKFSNFSANPLYFAKKLYLNNVLVTNLVIPDSVTSIRDYAFEYCSGLTSVTIPNSVTSIGYDAFKECERLTSVTIMSTTPPTLDSTAFTGVALKQVIVPAGCGEAYKTATNWSTYADYIIEEGMHRVTLGENVTCSVGGTSYSNQTFDVADQTVIHFEVGQPPEGGVAAATPDGIFLNGVLVSSDSEPATYDLTVTGNVSVTYSTGDVVGDITYNNCYKIVMS